jgi:hypothetical protein
VALFLPKPLFIAAITKREIRKMAKTNYWGTNIFVNTKVVSGNWKKIICWIKQHANLCLDDIIPEHDGSSTSYYSCPRCHAMFAKIN